MRWVQARARRGRPTNQRREAMTQLPQITVLGMDRAALASLVDSLGEPAYRADQRLEAVYRQRVDSIQTISTLPAALPSNLRQKAATAGLPGTANRLVPADGSLP